MRFFMPTFYFIGLHHLFICMCAIINYNCTVTWHAVHATNGTLQPYGPLFHAGDEAGGEEAIPHRGGIQVGGGVRPQGQRVPRVGSRLRAAAQGRLGQVGGRGRHSGRPR